MRAQSSAILGLALALAPGCGGSLDNLPLTLGVIHGTLVGSSPRSTVSVVGRPDLIASPSGSDGAFTLEGVPAGPVEVLALISSTYNETILTVVEGGAVTEVGRRWGRPTGTLELQLYAPARQRVARGVVEVVGTPLSLKLEDPGEWSFRVPAGTYRLTATVPGLGTQEVVSTIAEGQRKRVAVRFDPADGGSEHRGCSETGCEEGLQCRGDGSCEP
jgi:hypothetical protein